MGKASINPYGVAGDSCVASPKDSLRTIVASPYITPIAEALNHAEGRGRADGGNWHRPLLGRLKFFSHVQMPHL